MRRSHLQRGAFAVWQLMWSRSDSLKAREEQVLENSQSILKGSCFDLWRKRTDLKIREEEWSSEKDLGLMTSTFGEWRKLG